MYLFSRRARISPGHTKESLQWATDVAEKATQVSGLNVSLFQQQFSPEVGTMIWSAPIPDLGTLESASDKLLTDNAYLQLVDRGAQFTMPQIDDSLLQLVRGDAETTRQSEYVSSVSTVSSSGSFARGIELGIEIAERVEKTTGRPTQFATAATGSYGAVTWITGYRNIREMEESQQKLTNDTKFQQFIDGNVPDVYVDNPSVTQQRIYRRIV